MSHRLVVALFLFFAVLAPVVIGQSSARAAAAHAGGVDVERISDIPTYLDRLRQTIQLAKTGEYGKVKDQDMNRIEVAQGRIENILRDRKDDAGLSEDQRLDLFNAQETITSILRDDEDDRIVCTRLPGTGTRLTTKECMTVGQRKARAEQARQSAMEMKKSLGCVRDMSGQCMQ